MSFLKNLFQRSHAENTKDGVKRNDLPVVNKDWMEIRDFFYSNAFGSSPDTKVWHETSPVIPHIDIYVFPPCKELQRDFYTIVTSGMSEVKMNIPEGISNAYQRVEILLYLKELYKEEGKTPWYIEIMNSLSHLPFRKNTWLGVGHTISNGYPAKPLCDGSILTNYLLLNPVCEPDIVQNGFTYGKENVNFLWLTFLSDEETQYKLDHGVDEFFSKCNDQNFPVITDPYRKSIL
jgi:hypothetical protein